ncbi:hypothetical protein Rt10032_c01g0350 [Rhodotorula toruloides]|uniref:CENP-V/GFA domain-containing protein n=1 Tax=Rhodotorula toruloides TaxID=5286 RepID=A0A511K7K8_RHOTO|nr:hypothetical protein Rt10032_c01g0350 [Rhodotorula toruloides]
MGGAHEQADKNHTPDSFPDLAPYNTPADAFEGRYHASCHCGAVRYEAKGEPELSVCCHCHTCQIVHGATSQRALIYKKDHIKFPKECLDSVAFYQTCGTIIADEGRNMWMAMPALFRFDDHKEPASWAPKHHIFYKERALDLEKKEGVTYWEGAQEKSEKL